MSDSNDLRQKDGDSEDTRTDVEISISLSEERIEKMNDIILEEIEENYDHIFLPNVDKLTVKSIVDVDSIWKQSTIRIQIPREDKEEIVEYES